MPELPEIESLCHELKQWEGDSIEKIVFRSKKLRDPIPIAQLLKLEGSTLSSFKRRGKYILLHTAQGIVIFHLGMSGSLLILPNGAMPQKHDHVDFILTSGMMIRYHDPRRFGNIQFWPLDQENHALLRNIGPEPLTKNFHSSYLHKKISGRKRMIKDLLMDSGIVAGIGNIYVAEILFAAGIYPLRLGEDVSFNECVTIVQQTKKVLRKAIRFGGTSIRDYIHADGSKGGFAAKLKVYNREGETCVQCRKNTIVREFVHGRSIYYCQKCQK